MERKDRITYFEKPATVFGEKDNPLAEHDPDARIWSMLSHLSGILVILGVPFLHILGPLAILALEGKGVSFCG